MFRFDSFNCLAWDYDGDCHVNIIDLDGFSNDWLNSYSFVNFASFAQQWGM
jgi:hypothetical protein